MNWEKDITQVSFSFDYPYTGAASDRTWHVSLCINTVESSLLYSESKMQVHATVVARKTDVHLLMWFVLDGRTLNTMHFSLVFIMVLQIYIYIYIYTQDLIMIFLFHVHLPLKVEKWQWTENLIVALILCVTVTRKWLVPVINQGVTTLVT